MLQDIRYALRRLVQSPGFLAAAVLTLAIGIGANTVIFSLIDGILLKPLGYREPDRLVLLREVIPQIADLYPSLPVNAQHFLTWKEQSESFDEITLVQAIYMNMTGDGEPGRVLAGAVSWDIFPMLGADARIGRTFLESEGEPGSEDVAVLTHGFWLRRFGGDPAVLGSILTLNGQPTEIVGVLPETFRFPKSEELGPMIELGDGVELFLPLQLDPGSLRMTGAHNYGAIARLSPETTLEQAEAELNVLESGIATEAGIQAGVDLNMDLEARVTPMREQMIGPVRLALWVLLAAVGAVLAIVCVNLANLLLARSARRQKDVAVRVALGAPAGRLVREFLTESLILALAGGALGVAFAYVALDVLLATMPVDLPRVDEIGLDGRILGFGFALSVATGVLFGTLPAWRLTRIDPLGVLQAAGARTTESRRASRLRGALVSLEVGLSALLLITAGLLTTSFFRLIGVDTGFVVDNARSIELFLPFGAYGDSEARAGFYDRLIEEIGGIPGIESVAITSHLPLMGETNVSIVSVEGETRPLLERPLANYRYISPDYFQTLSIPLTSGRAFVQADRERDVVIVSAELAGKLWPGEEALGRRFYEDDDAAEPWTVIGVAADIRGLNLESGPGSMVYVPYWAAANSESAVIVRGGAETGLTEALRSAVWSVDPLLPVPEVRPMERLLVESTNRQRFQSTLASGFALVALFLASLGIYGVISQSVAGRTQEIGLRMALGADRRNILSLMVGQGMIPTLIGTAVGVLAAAASARVIASLLFGVEPTDPATFAGVIALLLSVAFLACYLPARRATRVDPLVALRYE